jgi:hypothetical protein
MENSVDGPSVSLPVKPILSGEFGVSWLETTSGEEKKAE